MGKPLRSLVLDNSIESVETMLRELRCGGFDVEHAQVESPGELRQALLEEPWDVVLAAGELGRALGEGWDEETDMFAGQVPVLCVFDRESELPPIAAEGAAHLKCLLREDIRQLPRSVHEEVQALEKKLGEEIDRELLHGCPTWEVDFTGVGEWLRFQGLASGAALRKYFRTYPEDRGEPALFAQVLSVNPAAARLMNRAQPGELLGTIARTWPTSFQNGWEALLAALADGRRILRVNTRLESGAPCTLSARLPLLDGDLSRVRITVRSGPEPGTGRLSPRLVLEQELACLDEVEPDPPVKELTPVPRPTTRAPEGATTVLLVDDQEAVRNVTRTVLLRNGFTVLEAASGADALALAKDHGEEIDVMLTDMSMPGMTGDELAREVRQHRPQTKVVYMSGYTAQPAQGEAFLQKPFLQATLLETLRDLLDAK